MIAIFLSAFCFLFKFIHLFTLSTNLSTLSIIGTTSQPSTPQIGIGSTPPSISGISTVVIVWRIFNPLSLLSQSSISCIIIIAGQNNFAFISFKSSIVGLESPPNGPPFNLNHNKLIMASKSLSLKYSLIAFKFTIPSEQTGITLAFNLLIISLSVGSQDSKCIPP